ncbi:MAG TPA: RNA degradosome polyphosphate kinase, partial [Methanoregula sp.]|nr:RNA degradosome polyphosphate kinase [Methanoregula sp.]
NLDKRVEILFPVEDPAIRTAITASILPVQLGDNVKIRILDADRTYSRYVPGTATVPLNAQGWLVEHRGIWHDAPQ